MRNRWSDTWNKDSELWTRRVDGSLGYAVTHRMADGTRVTEVAQLTPRGVKTLKGDK